MITACVPVSRGTRALHTLFAVANQSFPPDRIILYDSSSTSLGADRLSAEAIGYLGAELHIAPEGETDPQTARSYLASHALTDWLWFVDDDVLPWHTCLEGLYRLATSRELLAAQSTRIDLIEYLTSLGSNSAYPPSRNGTRREFDRQEFWCETASLLVKREAWLSADRSFIPSENAGEDVWVTTQIAQTGKVMTSSNAVALHLRERPPGRLGNATDNIWERVESIIPPEHLGRILKSNGGKMDQPDMPWADQYSKQRWLEEVVRPRLSQEEWERIAEIFLLPIAEESSVGWSTD